MTGQIDPVLICLSQTKQKTMDYENERQITVDIHFPYFKQGDDFGNCGGNLELFAAHHRRIADISLNILNNIPEEARRFVNGDGDTHSCWLSGPESVMRQLIADGLAERPWGQDEDFEEESDEAFEEPTEEPSVSNDVVEPQ